MSLHHLTNAVQLLIGLVWTFTLQNSDVTYYWLSYT